MVQRRLTARRALAAAATTLLVACGSVPPVPVRGPGDVRADLVRLLPADVADKPGWAADIQVAFSALNLAPSVDNLCAVIAITAQESGFEADPVIPALGKIAWEEIGRRADRIGVPMFAVRAALQITSKNGMRFADRIDAARSERELSEIFDDIVDMVPLGQRLFADWNPVRTGGPMQVGIAFAQAHAEARHYPYPRTGTIRNEVFTRRGGLYFGIAHLLDYRADYDALRYRFADYNAGHYASRNAAFQRAVEIAGGGELALDGDLVRRGAPLDEPGETEAAVRRLASRLQLDAGAIRRDLLHDDDDTLPDTATWRAVFALAEQRHGKPLPRAILPGIALSGPKITRKLTTEWFARRVDSRHQACVKRAR